MTLPVVELTHVPRRVDQNTVPKHQHCPEEEEEEEQEKEEEEQEED